MGAKKEKNKFKMNFRLKSEFTHCFDVNKSQKGIKMITLVSEIDNMILVK